MAPKSPQPSDCASTKSGRTVDASKRTRASKPKTRTGCITWIRRVKCGEEKPACLRCTSTDRVCDGYAKPGQSVALQKRDPSASRAEGILQAQQQYIEALSTSQGLRVLRPIACDIHGSDMERRFFRRFQSVAESNSFILRTFDRNSCWTQTAPIMSHSSDAVRHAVIALGAAFHTFESLSSSSTSENDELEVFIIQQYNKAMSNLRSLESHSLRSNKDHMTIILLCCLLFICIEILRGSWQLALTHLASGLRIIESLPRGTTAFLRGPQPGEDQPEGPSLDLQNIISNLAICEASCILFDKQLKPVLCLKLYEEREFDESPVPSFATAVEAHRGMANWTRDVFAFLWIVRDQGLWADEMLVHQAAILEAKGVAIGTLFDEYMATASASRVSTEDYESLCLGRIYVLCALFMIRARAQGYREDGHGCFAEIFTLISTLREHQAGPKQQEPSNQPRRVTLDVGTIPALFLIASASEDPLTRQKATHALQACQRRENVWDGLCISKMLPLVHDLQDKTMDGKALLQVPGQFETPSSWLCSGIPSLSDMLSSINLSP